MHPTIISRHFWPTLESSDIVMPGQFQTCVHDSHPAMLSYTVVYVVSHSFLDFKSNMPKNSPPSNQTRSSAGYPTWAQSIWSSNSRIELSKQMSRHWRLRLLSCSPEKVRFPHVFKLYYLPTNLLVIRRCGQVYGAWMTSSQGLAPSTGPQL